MDFNRPELPVTCGSATGTLYKEKYQQGEFPDLCASPGQWHCVGSGHLCCGYLIPFLVCGIRDIGNVNPSLK